MSGVKVWVGGLSGKAYVQVGRGPKREVDNGMFARAAVDFLNINEVTMTNEAGTKVRVTAISELADDDQEGER